MDYIAYIVSVHEKKEFLGRGMSDWSLSFEGLCVGSCLFVYFVCVCWFLIGPYFLGRPQVPER